MYDSVSSRSKLWEAQKKKNFAFFLHYYYRGGRKEQKINQFTPTSLPQKVQINRAGDWHKAPYCDRLHCWNTTGDGAPFEDARMPFMIGFCFCPVSHFFFSSPGGQSGDQPAAAAAVTLPPQLPHNCHSFPNPSWGFCCCGFVFGSRPPTRGSWAFGEVVAEDGPVRHMMSLSQFFAETWKTTCVHPCTQHFQKHVHLWTCEQSTCYFIQLRCVWCWPAKNSFSLKL